MANNINRPPGGGPPRTPVPVWPWGGPRSVRERLVDPTQLNRKKGKKGDPKNPPLASFALLDSIGPAHSSDELRLPEPPMPPGHEADLEGFNDRPYLASVAERGDDGEQQHLEMSLASINASPERKERLRGLLDREAQMLNVIQQLHQDITEVQRRMREEQSVEGA